MNQEKKNAESDAKGFVVVPIKSFGGLTHLKCDRLNERDETDEKAQWKRHWRNSPPEYLTRERKREKLSLRNETCKTIKYALIILLFC